MLTDEELDAMERRLSSDAGDTARLLAEVRELRQQLANEIVACENATERTELILRLAATDPLLREADDATWEHTPTGFYGGGPRVDLDDDD